MSRLLDLEFFPRTSQLVLLPSSSSGDRAQPPRPERGHVQSGARRHPRLARLAVRRGDDRHRHPALLEDAGQAQPRAHRLLQGPDGLHR